MTSKPKILAIPGSLRCHSFNKRVLAIAAQGAEKAGAKVTYLDLIDYPLAIYNADDHQQKGFSQNALRLQRLLNTHDGLLIATPSYNGSLPAVLKNAIDWASRPNQYYQKRDIFMDKTAAIMSASPGSLGGVRALGHLRDVLTSVKVHVLPTEVAVTFAEERFDGDNPDMIDQEMRQTLENLGESLVEMIWRTFAQLDTLPNNGRHTHHPIRII
jgi:chromate reductase